MSPAEPGAYLLIVDLPRAVELAIRGRPVRVPPGRYAYCGSAYGPGGIGARTGRHLRPEKVARWHIDRLTEAGRIEAVLAVPGGEECVLRDRLLTLDGAAPSVAGFGSSDCRRCPGHLVRLAAGLGARQAARATGGRVCLDRAR